MRSGRGDRPLASKQAIAFSLQSRRSLSTTQFALIEC
jgi:hypothetical protein